MEITNTTPERVLTTLTQYADGWHIIVTRCYSDSHTIKTYRTRTYTAARKFARDAHDEVASA